jgi:hypothetical protein
LAAEALCESIGAARTMLVPDLKPQGFMRWIKQGIGNRE